MGTFFSAILIFLFPTVRVPKTSNPMRYLVFWSFRAPVHSRVYYTWETRGLYTHMGGRIEGSHSLRRGNASTRVPTGSVICAGEITVWRYSVGSLFQCGLVIQERIVPAFLLNSDSGGVPWLVTSEILFWPAQFVLVVRLPIEPGRVTSTAVCPFETLVPHRARFCHCPPRAIRCFDCSGPVLEGGPFHSPCPNYPLPMRQRLLSLITSFAFMASRWTWSPTGDPNLSPNFGGSSVVYWGRVSVCPPSSEQRPNGAG